VKKRLAENDQFRYEGVFSLTNHYKFKPINLKVFVLLFAVFLFAALPAWAGMNQWTGNGPYGAYLRCIAVSPNYLNDKTIFIGTDNRGLFRSTNSGQSWSHVGPETGVRSIAISPNFTIDGTVFAGSMFAGVYKSTDRGQTWVQMNNDYGITSLVISPNFITDGTIFSASYFGNGSFQKSTDYGLTWVKVEPGVTNVITSIVFSPNYVIDKTVFAGVDGGILKSSDNGQSWTMVYSWGVLYSGSDNDHVYALGISPQYESDGTIIFAKGHNESILLKSTDRGQTWVQINLNNSWGYYQSIVFSPNYSSDGNIFAGSLYGIQKSTDNGQTWNSIVSAPTVNAIGISPSYNSDHTIFVANSDGVYKSTDSGTTWAIANSGLIASDIYDIAFSPNYAVDETVYASLMNNGFYKSSDATQTWEKLCSVHFESFVISPNNSTDKTLFAGGGGGIYKSIDSGLTWNQLTSDFPNHSINSVALSPNYSIDKTVYAANAYGGGVYKSADDGNTWNQVNNGLSNTNITSIALSPNYSNDMTIIAMGNQGFYMSTNGAQLWTQINSGITGTISSVAFSPRYVSDSIVFAGGSGGVFKSNDRGQTWSSCGIGDFIASLSISPSFASDNTIFAGSIYGGLIHKSADGGSTWISMSAGLPTSAPVRKLAASPKFKIDNTVFAGTWGGGVFSYTFSAIQLPRTGQTTSYAAGDDGDIHAGVAWPSPRFTDNGDQTITDYLTGLIWTKDAGTPTVGSCTGGTMNLQSALDYVACLNSADYLGHNDWRLPNVNELESLVNAEQVSSDTWLNGQGFTNVQAFYYWSSTTRLQSTVNGVNTDNTWLVNMSYGSVDYDFKWRSYYVYVWPVRAGQGGMISISRTGQSISYASGDDGDLQKGAAWPDPRFTDNGNGTVKDNLTGLVWLKNAGCFGYGRTWSQGLSDAINLADGQCGLSDGSQVGEWRLPNKNELFSLIDYSKYGPAIPTGYPFTNVWSGYSYWASTTFAPNSPGAWSVGMYYGEGGGGDKTGPEGVWPVRGGIVTIPTTHTITASSGANGSISPSETVSVNHGDSQSFTITPNANYHVAGVLVDNVSQGAITSYTFNNVTANHTISASFAMNTVTHTIIASAGAYGSISPTGSVTVNHNATKSFTVTPDTDYIAVMSGTCGGNLVGSTYTTNPITADCSVTANFNPSDSNQSLPRDKNVEVQVPVSLPSGGLGTVKLIFDQVTTGGTLSISATGTPLGGGPPTGFKFLGTYYNVTVTGGFSFSEDMYITFPYDDSSIPSGKEANLRLYHWRTSGGWEDCTYSLDITANTITGRVTSLSPFAMGYSTSSGGGTGGGGTGGGGTGGGYSTGANENMIALITILAISAGVFILRKNRRIKKA